MAQPRSRSVLGSGVGIGSSANEEDSGSMDIITVVVKILFIVASTYLRVEITVP